MKAASPVRQIQPAFVDNRGAARYVGLSVRTLDDARTRGDLPYHRHGRKILFAVTDLDRYLARFRVALPEAQ